MGNGDNRCYIPYIVISCLFYALPSFARRKHFSAYIYNVSPIWKGIAWKIIRFSLPWFPIWWLMRYYIKHSFVKWRICDNIGDLVICEKMRIFAYRKQLYFCRYERFWSHSSSRARSTVSEAYLEGRFRLVWWVWLSSRQIIIQHLLEKMNQAYTGREFNIFFPFFLYLTFTII